MIPLTMMQVFTVGNMRAYQARAISETVSLNLRIKTVNLHKYTTHLNQ